MLTFKRFAFALAFALLLGHGSIAAAQEPSRGVARDSGHLDVKLMLGLGGEVEYDPDGPGSWDDDLNLTYGLGLAYVHPLHRFFALGLQLSFSSWISDEQEDADLDRNTFVDISLLPQGKYAISNDLELYATVPIGLSISIPGEDEYVVSVGGIGSVTLGEWDTALGFNIGLMLGARFAISDGFGLLAELGYVAHSAAHEVEVPNIAGLNVTEDVDVSLGQFALNLGVWF